MTPLMQACRKDDYEGVQSLINKGANLEVYDAVSTNRHHLTILSKNS